MDAAMDRTWDAPRVPPDVPLRFTPDVAPDLTPGVTVDLSGDGPAELTVTASRYGAAELASARRRIDHSISWVRHGGAAEPIPTASQAAEVCAARRRFDDALGREGTGGAESFQPKFATRRSIFGPDEAGTQPLADRAQTLLQRIDEERPAPRSRPVPDRASDVIVVPTPAPPRAVPGSTPMPPMAVTAPTPVEIGPRRLLAPAVPTHPARAVATLVEFDAIVAKIRTLGALRNEGLLTDEEYERTKARLLAGV